MAKRKTPRMANCKTMSVPEAGRKYYGSGRNGSYAAAKVGVIPTKRIRGKLRVPVILMDRSLEQPDKKQKTSDAGAAA